MASSYHDLMNYGKPQPPPPPPGKPPVLTLNGPGQGQAMPVELADGRIVESGSHGELLARGGEYARMWALQQAAAREEAAQT